MRWGMPRWGLEALLALSFLIHAVPVSPPLLVLSRRASGRLRLPQHKLLVGSFSALRGGSGAHEDAVADQAENLPRISEQMTAIWAQTDLLRIFAASPPGSNSSALRARAGEEGEAVQASGTADGTTPDRIQGVELIRSEDEAEKVRCAPRPTTARRRCSVFPTRGACREP